MKCYCPGTDVSHCLTLDICLNYHMHFLIIGADICKRNKYFSFLAIGRRLYGSCRRLCQSTVQLFVRQAGRPSVRLVPFLPVDKSCIVFFIITYRISDCEVVY